MDGVRALASRIPFPSPRGVEHLLPPITAQRVCRNSCCVTGKVLHEPIRHTAFAVSAEESRAARTLAQG